MQTFTCINPLISVSCTSFSDGAQSVWIDKHDTSGSCAAGEKTAIEFEDKNKDEDEGRFQEEDVDTAN